MTGTQPALDVARFDELPAAEATELLRAAVASDAWLSAMVAGRPYGDLTAVLTRSDATLRDLAWPDVEQALGAHPRIGDRVAGTDREATWSRAEQASTAGMAADSAAALREGNVEYENRFGHVFLVCATGLSPEQMLAALHDRLHNSPEHEQQVVAHELAAIAELRLRRILT